MKISTDGLVIREQNIKEQDKLITVLTRSNGVIRAFVHGAKSIKSPKSTATGLLTYSRFVFYKSRESYIIDECSAKEVFMPLRRDIEKLALAQYFCELLEALSPEDDNAEEQLRLVLNSLYFLCQDTRHPVLIKSILELRLLTLSGYMPNLVCCDGCACFEHEHMNFLPENGILVCGDCIGSYKQRHIETGFGVTLAMRHCIYSEFNKLFAFDLSKEALPVLEYVTEEYMSAHIQRKFKALEFYKQIRTFDTGEKSGETG